MKEGAPEFRKYLTGWTLDARDNRRRSSSIPYIEGRKIVPKTGKVFGSLVLAEGNFERDSVVSQIRRAGSVSLLEVIKKMR